MQKVFIIQDIIPNYREPFFRDLAKEIDLTVFYSKLSKSAKSKSFVQKDKFTDFKNVLIPSFSFRNRVYQFSFLKHILISRPSVVIAQNLGHLDMLLALILCKLLSIDFYWWNGGIPYTKNDEMHSGFISKLFGNNDPRILLSKFATGMLVYSNHAKNYFKNKGYNNRIIVAPNSPDTNNFFKLKKKFSKSPDLLLDYKNKFSPNGEKIILLLGRLDKTRRTNDLIKAFQILRKDELSISLVIVGDGSEKEANQKLVKKLGLKNVYFEGAIYEDELLSKYYMICDFFVTPGVCSMAIKISMLFGVPVITADYGLEVHAVQHGVNGYVYQLGNYKKIAFHIKHLIKDQKIYSKISKNSVETIEKHININKMIKSFLMTTNIK
tara:strand:- start:146 stop:1288 length:1143 start_codon:yes stop_codon:yes gene_type:complete